MKMKRNRIKKNDDDNNNYNNTNTKVDKKSDTLLNMNNNDNNDNNDNNNNNDNDNNNVIDLGTTTNDNLTEESCFLRLSFVEAEKEYLKQYLSRIISESRLELDTSIEEMKAKLDDELKKLSSTLNNLYNNQDFIYSQMSEPVPKKMKHKSKVFIPQDSILSKMLHYNDENYKTIFHIAICVLAMWGSKLAFYDYLERGLPNFELLTWGIFRDIRPFFLYWFCMFVSTFSIVPLSHFTTESHGVISFRVLVTIYIIMQLTAFYFSGWVVSSRNKPFAMPLAIGFMAEQARMSMKMHSYFREKVLWKKYQGRYSSRPISNGNIPVIGLLLPDSQYFTKECSNFFYFHFTPTLLYRCSYPRTSRIRWGFTMRRLLEVLGIVYYAFLIFREAIPYFIETAGVPLTAKEFVIATFNCMGPGMASMIFTHFLVLHVVQNIGAELTRFADRKFYDDWWNSRTFSVFYRKWNGVVHDFIHAYLYSDMVEILKLPKLLALVLSFLVSALVHEYLVCLAMGFFLPILATLFTGPGLVFILLTKNKTGRIWNIFMWLMLTTGNAMLMVLYMREYFMRSHGPAIDMASKRAYSDMGINDFFIPRTLRIQFLDFFK